MLLLCSVLLCVLANFHSQFKILVLTSKKIISSFHKVMASATKVYSCKNLNPTISLSGRDEIHESTRELCSRAGLPTRQLLPELHLKFEKRVALNCMSIVVKSFRDMKWKCCGLFLNLSAFQGSSSLQIPQLQDGKLEFWEALETCVYLFLVFFLLEKVLKDKPVVTWHLKEECLEDNHLIILEFHCEFHSKLDSKCFFFI